MKILMVGSGSAGSWVMRGQQLGVALGARVTITPTPADFDWADLVVLVKRAGAQWATMAKASGKPIVWDALDFWQQPNENGHTKAEALTILLQAIQWIEPALTIGATEAMAVSAGGAFVPHHGWDGLTPNFVNERVHTVGYQGNVAYLGRWSTWIKAACWTRGWQFVVNPQDLRYADILVSLRDGEWDGWMCREWKSGVKLVNAVAAGRPVIGQDSAAMRELKPAGSVIETRADLEQAFDEWAAYEARALVLEESKGKAKAFTVRAVAAQYMSVLATVKSQVSA